MVTVSETGSDASADVPIVESPETPQPYAPQTRGRGSLIAMIVGAVVVAALLTAGLMMIQSLRDDTDELEEEVAALEREVVDLERQVEADQAAIEDASDRSDEIEAEAAALAERLAAAEAAGSAPADQSSATVEVAGAAGGLPMFPGNGVPDPALGLPMPDIAGVDHLTGEPVDIADGSATMVMVWAHWCPHCQRELPEVQALVDEGFFADNGVELITVATFEDPSRGNPFEEMVEQYSFPVIRDDRARASQLGLGGVPSWVIVDADGIVIGRFSGALGSDVLRGVVEQVAADT